MDNLPAYIKKNSLRLAAIFIALSIVLSAGLFYIASENKKLISSKDALTIQLQKTEKEFIALKNEDQVKRNDKLEADMKEVKETYNESIDLYEGILDLKAQKVDTKDLDSLYAKIVKELSEFKYTSASADLIVLGKELQKKTPATTAVGTAASAVANASVSNTPPGTGYGVQAVKTDIGTFNVAIIAADLGSTRVIVDTASDGTCGNECPVMALGDYVARSGAYAGINGSFFCPKEYPSCAGKTNSFDLLVMNKNKVYFNSENNVYSTNPAVIFGSGWIRFVGRALEWGRDTSVDGVLSNYPLYVSGGGNVFGGSGDAKLTSKGARTFVANKGNTVYIGIVYGASSDDAAKVLTALGMDNAMGLDQGGSTALWFNGYKAGPGRGIPNAILFVRK